MTEPSRAGPARLLEETSRLVGASLNEIVPPQAQTHLLNAQRELLLALAVTIEHNTSRAARSPRGARRTSGAGAKKSTNRPKRVELD